MKPALLDTNVLLALVWPNHQHHAAAHQWFRREAGNGWATCAVTQLGFVRLSSNPAYTASAVAPGQAAAVLAELTSHEAHRFWDSPVASDATIYGTALGHQQVNDAYLVAVAEARKGRLVTLDQRLSVHATRKDVVFTITT